MQLFVFSVYDKAVGAYLQPFYARAKGEAIRQFTEACHDEKSLFAKHGTDYLLVYLGSFDDVTGLFTTGEPERLLAAHEAIARSERKLDPPLELKAVN